MTGKSRKTIWSKITYVASMVFLSLGCATPSVDKLSDKQYQRLIKDSTRLSNQYNGLYQMFQAEATFMSRELIAALLDRKAQYLKWDSKQMSEEKERENQFMSHSTRIVLRFFAPEADYNDLADANTIWKIYLETNGSRYVGEIKKSKEKTAELMMLYPFHDSFSTLYNVTFKVPTAEIELHGGHFILTSTIGTAEFDYRIPGK